MSKIQDYIKANWNTLPKSSFDEVEVVMFDTVTNEDGGYGHHSYEGYGVLQNGDLVCAHSSGCSCDGSCSTNTVAYYLDKEKSLHFDNYTPEEIDFGSHEVSFSSYG